MFRYGLPQYSTSSPSLAPPGSANSNESMESLDDALKHKTLTPQRKHHKLLKDGSEVWSQEVEKIFVEGLRKYWQSPWATYSRGRSRWRNQFLVDHLKRAGIERSKKQVASHIQVLRNMWRGEPEFHLVAGGEELFQENGLLASPKRKANTESPEPPPPSNLDPPDAYPQYSPSSSTPDFSALEFPIEICSPTSGTQLTPPPMMHFGDPSIDENGASLSSMHDSAFATITPSSARARARPPVKLEPLAMDPGLFTLPQNPFPDATDFAYASPSSSAPNRVCGVSFWADAMLPSTIDVDRLTSASIVSSASQQQLSPFRILLRLNLSISPSDIRSPPNVQGFNGAVSFAAQWASSAKCHTKTWTGKACISHEVGLLDQLSPPQLHPGLGCDGSSPSMVIAYLPDSALSRCRWLDTIQTITQQIVVDNEVLAVLIYTLDRTASVGSTPTVELVGFHKYPWRMPSPQPFSSSPSISPISPTFPPSYSPPGYSAAPVSSPQTPLFARPSSYGEDVPLSCALDFSRTSAMHVPSPTTMNPTRLF
ncbi:hypothetical protein AcW1_005919 [Taiwanofungus camphoratus]|nr:hypothetical protein AcV5_006235 [Antrodia cinnamomea]KAI0957572.1 hypothetical protein AcW1_005919 [Antrodia cinnamomea]